MSNNSTGDNDPITLKLVGLDEKKEFLAMFMSYKMELVSSGIEVQNTEGEDQLSRFWNDPDSNYLFWIYHRSRKVGFTAIHVLDLERANLLNIHIFRDDRGKGLGKRSVQEVCKFIGYRGLKYLNIEMLQAPDRILEFFTSIGFESKDRSLTKSV